MLLLLLLLTLLLVLLLLPSASRRSRRWVLAGLLRSILWVARIHRQRRGRTSGRDTAGGSRLDGRASKMTAVVGSVRQVLYI
jgi:hypothetical protein